MYNGLQRLYFQRFGLGVAHQTGHAGEALAHAHAPLLVQEERVGFDGQVMFQGNFGLDQSLQSVLRLHQPLLKFVDGILNLPYLTHKSEQSKTKRSGLLLISFTLLKM